MMLASMRQQARASTGWCWPMHCAPSARRTLTTPRHNATKLHASRPCRAAAQRSARRSHSAVVPQAYLHSDPSADSSGASGSLPGQLKVLVVGANAAGLAAAVALAQQARCAVEVHDSRPDPRDDQNAHDSSSSSTLVALGKRGLEALSHLDLPLHSCPSNSSSSSSTGAIAGLWTPGTAATGALAPTGVSATSSPQPSGATGGASGGMAGTEPLLGLLLLQGMVVVGPRGEARREAYSRAASRGKQPSDGASVTEGMTAGVVAVDELTLTTRLLLSAAAPSRAPQASQSLQPQLVLPGAQAAAVGPGSGRPSSLGSGSAAGGTLRPKGTTAIPQGPTTAPSAEAAQEAALPPVVPTPGTASSPPPPAPASAAVGTDAGTMGRGGSVGEAGAGVSQGDSTVEVHYSSHLTLFDAANKQATFMGPGGAATIVPYDLCIAADASGGGHLVTSALQELQDRQAAHKHPSSPAHHSSGSSAAGGVSELEYRAWQDMPPDAALAAMLGQPVGASKASSSPGPGSSATSPQQGWLLVWTGPGTVQAAHPGLSSAGGPGSTAIIPGAPSCTVMAWPSKGGTTWSGCVFTQPQVLEALRSQSDYEQFLGSFSAPAELNAAKLPPLWVRGIAAQLRSSDRVSRVPAAVTPPPKSLSAPDAGLVALTTAAVASSSPQLLNPGVARGLAEASRLAAALSAQLAAADGSAGGASGGKTAVTDRAEGFRKAVQQGLRQFDAQHGPEAQALHKLTAQLSWLRHPFSPAAPTAAASVPFGSLAAIFAALGAPRTGLALQWRCLLAVLPLVAAVQRVLLYKLGLGRPGGAAAATGSQAARPDASYRRAAAAAAAGASSSLDSGVHVSKDPAQAQKEAAALSAVAGLASHSAPAYGLAGLADSVEPCGASFSSFLHTTDMPPTGIFRLLQVAPLLVSVLWGALLWAGVQAVHWGLWAFRAWGWSQSGIA